ILIFCFNLKSPYLLGSATFVVNGNETDRQALLQFKAKISGDQLGIMRLWNSSVHFCQWRGVKCSQRHQRVTKLDLRALRLMGSISPFIGNLSFLRMLNLQNNSFSLGVPQEIGRLSRLQQLTLDRNFISGEIPSNLSGCSKLRRLYIGHNLLAGEIPATLSPLSSLKELGFSNKTLSGSIPPSLGNLTSLGTIYLSLNRFTGVIPESLGQLNNLTIFSVAVNEISAGLSSLSIGLALSSNRLTGVLPSEVGNLRNLGILDVSQNMLSGVIPNDLGNCIRLELLLMRGNFFQGSIPSSLSSLRGLTNLDISNNNLTGEIPKFLVTFDSLLYLNLSHNDFEGVVPVDGVFKNVSAAFLEGNAKLCGGTPQFHLPACDSLKQHGRRSTISLEIGVACSVELPNQRMCMTDVVAELCSIRDKLLPTRSSGPTVIKVKYFLQLQVLGGTLLADDVAALFD
ncbi:hypothetical protein QUC31_010635, partial [Theobroma cacao]